MNRVGVTQRYSEDLLNEIFHDERLVERNQVLRGYALLIDGKFWVRDGKFLWQDRKSLIQSFYNSMRWRACRKIYLAENPEISNPYAWPRDGGSRRIWREFKRTLEQYHGFQIVYI